MENLSGISHDLPSANYSRHIKVQKTRVVADLQNLATSPQMSEQSALAQMLKILSPFDMDKLANYGTGELDNTDDEKARITFPWYAAFTDIYQEMLLMQKYLDTEGGLTESQSTFIEIMPKMSPDYDPEFIGLFEDLHKEEARSEYASIQHYGIYGRLIQVTNVLGRGYIEYDLRSDQPGLKTNKLVEYQKVVKILINSFHAIIETRE